MPETIIVAKSYWSSRSVAVMPRTATADRVDREALLEFLRPRHQAVLLTRRREGGAQLSR